MWSYIISVTKEYSYIFQSIKDFTFTQGVHIYKSDYFKKYTESYAGEKKLTAAGDTN